MIMMPMAMLAAKRVERADVDEDGPEHSGRDEREREVAVDDRRDAGEQLEDRLEDRAHAGRRVLAQVDGGSEAERHGDQHREERHEQRGAERAGEHRTACS